MDHGPGDRRRSDLGGRPGPRSCGEAGSSPGVAPLCRIVGARGLHWLVRHVTGRAEARCDERPPRPHRAAGLLRGGVRHCRVLIPVHLLNWFCWPCSPGSSTTFRSRTSGSLRWRDLLRVHRAQPSRTARCHRGAASVGSGPCWHARDCSNSIRRSQGRRLLPGGIRVRAAPARRDSSCWSVGIGASDHPASAPCTSTALVFPLPIFLFGSPYAAVAGMTIAHGLQYLSLVGLVALGAEPGARRTRSTMLFGGVALTGGDRSRRALAPARVRDAVPAPLFGLYLGLACSALPGRRRTLAARDAFPRSFLTGRVALPGSSRSARPASTRLPVDRLPI